MVITLRGYIICLGLLFVLEKMVEYTRIGEMALILSSNYGVGIVRPVGLDHRRRVRVLI